MEVEITWGRVVTVWWAYAWRNLVAILVGTLIGGALGFALGLILGSLGIAPSTIKMITTLLGAIIGIALSIIPMKMILGKDFGQFRLALVAKE